MKCYLQHQMALSLRIFFLLFFLVISVITFSQGTPLTKCFADNDGDGFGNPNDYILVQVAFGCGFYSGRVTNDFDCDDTNAAINPNTKWYKDFDKDGYTDWVTIVQCNRPIGYKLFEELSLANATDCNDSDPIATYEGETWYSDPDNDGYIDASRFQYRQCEKPEGNYVSYTQLRKNGTFVSEPLSSGNGTMDVQKLFDCNQFDPLEYPGQKWYPDLDGDGFAGSNIPVVQCGRPPHYKTSGELSPILDCDDNNADFNPDAAWVIDRDKDGYYAGTPVIQCTSPGEDYSIKNNQQEGDCDDNDPLQRPGQIWMRDDDGDMHGAGIFVGGTVLFQCQRPAGYFAASELLSDADCNDKNVEINPKTLWYLDEDKDGYANNLYIPSPEGSCLPPQDGRNYIYNPKGSDCNDNNAEINAATLWYLDEDKDGYANNLYIPSPEGSCLPPLDGRNYIYNPKGSDCADNDATNNPETEWVIDKDGDGYYTGNVIIGCQFLFVEGLVKKVNQQPGDCRDDLASVYPGATEICDGFDNDCDGTTDEGFADTDGDGLADCTDPDDDNDGIPDADDCAPLDAVNTPLVLNCPQDISINNCNTSAIETLTTLAYNTTGSIISEQQLIAAKGSVTPGVCAIATITYKDAEDAASTSIKKVIKRTFNVTDIKGRLFTCTQTITVEDKTAPTVQTRNITVELNNAGTATITDNAVNFGSSENCTSLEDLKFSTDIKSFSCADIGRPVTVTMTVTDASENFDSKTAIVTVVDKIKPTVGTQNITVQLDPNGSATISDDAVNFGSSDNCTSAANLKLSTDIKSFSCADIGKPVTVTVTVTDASGNFNSKTATVTVVNHIQPVITSITTNPSSLWPPNRKMKPVTINVVSNDVCGTTTCKIINVSSNEPIDGTGDDDIAPDWLITGDNTVNLRAERGAAKSQRIYTIAVECRDASGNATTGETSIVVAHNITAPVSGSSYKIGSTISFAGTFWDVPGNKHTARWVVDNSTVTGRVTAEPSGLKNGTVTGSYKFSTAGVYKLRMEIIDQDGNVSYANTNGDMDAIVVIYDPNGGYAFGGGKFYSEAGAHPSYPSAKGMVSYGFQSNYFKTATYPKGETQFEFKVGDFEFNALNYEYLAISGAKAQFKGSGKITNGQSGVSFIMTVIDGALDGTGTDKIHMKIFNKNTGEIYYDNQPGTSDDVDPTTVVKTGSTIVIVNNEESKGGGGKGGGVKPVKRPDEIVTESLFEVVSAPNPSNSYFTITVKSSNTNEPVRVSVMDELGRVIERKENVMPGSTIRLGENYIRGMYFVMVIQDSKRKLIKLIKQ